MCPEIVFFLNDIFIRIMSRHISVEYDFVIELLL